MPRDPNRERVDRHECQSPDPGLTLRGRDVLPDRDREPDQREHARRRHDLSHRHGGRRHAADHQEDPDAQPGVAKGRAQAGLHPHPRPRRDRAGLPAHPVGPLLVPLPLHVLGPDKPHCSAKEQGQRERPPRHARPPALGPTEGYQAPRPGSACKGRSIELCNIILGDSESGRSLHPGVARTITGGWGGVVDAPATPGSSPEAGKMLPDCSLMMTTHPCFGRGTTHLDPIIRGRFRGRKRGMRDRRLHVSDAASARRRGRRSRARRRVGG